MRLIGDADQSLCLHPSIPNHFARLAFERGATRINNSVGVAELSGLGLFRLKS